MILWQNTRVLRDFKIKLIKMETFNRIAVANADLALGRGEVDSALNILTMIGPEQIYFIQVRCINKTYHVYLCLKYQSICCGLLLKVFNYRQKRRWQKYIFIIEKTNGCMLNAIVRSLKNHQQRKATFYLVMHIWPFKVLITC